MALFLTRKKSTHHQTGETVRYPFIVFEDKEQQRELLAQIREKGKAFIEAKLVDGNLLIIPEQNKKESKETKPSIGSNSVPVAKKSASIANPMNGRKVWVDPPKRIQTAKHGLKRRG